MLVILATKAQSDIYRQQKTSTCRRPCVSLILLFAKRQIESAVLDAVQTKPCKLEGQESWAEIAQQAIAWISVEEDPHDREEWLGSFAWARDWLGLFACRNLFGVARERGKHYTGERKKRRRGHIHFSGNPRHCADELRATLRAMEDVSELRGILLEYVAHVRTLQQITDAAHCCPVSAPATLSMLENMLEKSTASEVEQFPTILPITNKTSTATAPCAVV